MGVGVGKGEAARYLSTTEVQQERERCVQFMIKSYLITPLHLGELCNACQLGELIVR